MILFQDSNQEYFEVARTGTKKIPLTLIGKRQTLDYYFEKRQNILFQVFDEDESSSQILGEVHSCLGDLVAQGMSILKLDRGG